MRVLLDTHSFLWFTLNDSQLSSSARAIIANPANEVFISPATYWEVAIKIGIKKYVLTEPYQTFFETQIQLNRFTILAIHIRHTMVLTTLPLFHRDPFDRLLIAQAMVEVMPLVSVDTVMDQYPATRIW